MMVGSQYEHTVNHIIAVARVMRLYWLCCSSMERPKRNALKKWDDDFVSAAHPHASSSAGFVL